jgi:hypothetical protein
LGACNTNLLVTGDAPGAMGSRKKRAVHSHNDVVLGITERLDYILLEHDVTIANEMFDSGIERYDQKRSGCVSVRPIRVDPILQLRKLPSYLFNLITANKVEFGLQWPKGTQAPFHGRNVMRSFQ